MNEEYNISELKGYVVFNYIKFLNDHKEEIHLRFLPFEKVYYVYRKRNKVIIREIKIDSIEITNMINYISYGCGLSCDKMCFDNSSKDVFSTKEEAYEYAEKLDRRSNIKFINYVN